MSTEEDDKKLREVVSDLRDVESDRRDIVSDQRDKVADRRDAVSDARDIADDKRNNLSDRRIVIEDERLIITEKRHLVSEKFEQMVTDTLRAQDKILTKVEIKLESPVLNGGFDDLVKTVSKIESTLVMANQGQREQAAQLTLIHDGIYDPEKGLYHKVKENTKWITQANTGLKWFVALVITGVLTGTGKLLYDGLAHHLHYMP